jgi:hypothetical protein
VCGQSGNAVEIFNILKTGFRRFGSEGVIQLYSSRQHYFEALYQRLLKNYHYTDRDFDYYTEVLHGRGMILRLVSHSGVFQGDIEDVVQEILENFWKSHWIERYNPLISSWAHFIYQPVKNYVVNYLGKSRRKKRYCPGLVQTDFVHVYSTSREDDPEYVYQIKEFLGKWEDFLRTQPAFIRGNRADSAGPPFKRLCTLLPPGSSEIPTLDELTLYFLRKGTSTCRVAVPELYVRGVSSIVSNESLIDYISMDEDTYESLRDPGGNWLTQKFFINPLYLDYRRNLFKSFDYLDFYHYLRDGLTIEEIAVLLNLSYKSVPYWLRKIEGLFRSFWLISDLVPMSMKYLSTDSYKCPSCSRLNYQNSGSCKSCGANLADVPGKPRFSLYPWPRVFTRREIKESYEQRASLLSIKLCAM